MNNQTTKQPILIVEDSPEDYEAVMRALRRVGCKHPTFHCADGDDALDFLWRRGQYADDDIRPAPGLILLDLNLPGTDGRDVLQAVKGDSNLRLIPVVVLSTSGSERDVTNCYLLGANAYVHKPVGIDKLMRVMASVEEFWLETAVLPKGENHV